MNLQFGWGLALGSLVVFILFKLLMDWRHHKKQHSYEIHNYETVEIVGGKNTILGVIDALAERFKSWLETNDLHLLHQYGISQPFDSNSDYGAIYLVEKRYILSFVKQLETMQKTGLEFTFSFQVDLS